MRHVVIDLDTEILGPSLTSARVARELRTRVVLEHNLALSTVVYVVGKRLCSLYVDMHVVV